LIIGVYSHKKHFLNIFHTLNKIIDLFFFISDELV